MLPSRQRNAIGTSEFDRFAAQYLARALPCERFTSALAGRRASLGVLACASSVSLRVHYYDQSAAAPAGRMRMTTSRPVVQHIPYLRRYARVLTGNQA
jgi:hypothetical protein